MELRPSTENGACPASRSHCDGYRVARLQLAANVQAERRALIPPRRQVRRGGARAPQRRGLPRARARVQAPPRAARDVRGAVSDFVLPSGRRLPCISGSGG